MNINEFLFSYTKDVDEQELILALHNNIDVIMDNNYKWVTLYQLKQMTRYECSINIEARTLLSIASYYKK